jgi:uncharacterized protein YjbJ (UPF0337 family)
MQQQATQSAQDFYGNSVGGIKSRIQDDRAQLESLAQQMSEGDAKAQIQEMIDSYNELESSMDQAAQEQGVEDTANQAAQQPAEGAAQQAQDTAGQADGQATEQAGQVSGQAQEAAGQATDQAQQAAGQATEQAGQVSGQAQETAGQATDQAQEAAG